MRLAYAAGIRECKKRRRSIGSLKGEMIAMLQIKNVAVVPTDSIWNVLYSTFGVLPKWSIEKIAAHIDIAVKDLNAFMANLAVSTASLGDYADVRDFIHAIEQAK